MILGVKTEFFMPSSGIVSNQDLNDIAAPGAFLCSSSSVAASLRNCPVAVPFVLWAFRNNASPYQVQVVWSQSGVYLRLGNTAAWKKLSLETI